MIDDAVAAGPARSGRRHALPRGGRIAIIVVLVAALVGAGLGVWRWQRGLALFGTGGTEIGGEMLVGHTSYVLALTGGHTGAVDLDSASAHVVSDTAEADIRVVRCQANGTILVGGATSHHPYCDHLDLFTPGSYTFAGAEDSSMLVLAITPLRPGRVDIDGLDLAYHRGIRSGEQNVGQLMSFRAVRSLG